MKIHPDTHTCKHKQTYTRHIGTDTCTKNTGTLTIHRLIQRHTERKRHTETYSHRDHTQTHRHTQTHTETHTEMHIYVHACTHRHTDILLTHIRIHI